MLTAARVGVEGPHSRRKMGEILHPHAGIVKAIQHSLSLREWLGVAAALQPESSSGVPSLYPSPEGEGIQTDVRCQTLTRHPSWFLTPEV
jgi:hypothetical protein